MKNVSKIQLLALTGLIGLSSAQINAQSFLTRYKKPILISLGVAATVISAIYGFKSKKQNHTNSTPYIEKIGSMIETTGKMKEQIAAFIVRIFPVLSNEKVSIVSRFPQILLVDLIQLGTIATSFFYWGNITNSERIENLDRNLILNELEAIF